MSARSFRYPLLAGTTAAALFAASAAQGDTLEEALIAAYQDNPSLEGARANQRALDESVPIEKSFGRPSANATVTHIEFLRRSPNSFTAPERTLSAQVDLGLPIYSGGGVKNAVRAAEERVEAGQADLRAIESGIFSQVVAAYMDVMLGEAVVGLRSNQVQVLNVNLQATSDRFEIGDLTRTDIAQSQSRLALAQSDLRSGEASLIAARETYIQLTGLYPDDLQPPPPLPNLPESAEQAVLTALANNPDLVAARERYDAAGFDIRVAGASRLPSVSLFSRGNYTDYYGTLGGPSAVQFAQSETTANAGVQVTIPIFQGGRPAALQRQATARASAALENMIAVERNTIADTRGLYANWQAANAIIESSQIAVDAADLSLEGVRAENSIGNRTILDVLNAEQELLNARVQLVTARRNAYVAGFNLLAFMGLAEARDLGLGESTPLYDPQINYERVQGKWWDWHRDPTPEAQSTRTVDIRAADAEVYGPQ